MSDVNLYVAGDYYLVCDECGFKVRSSETKKRWDGMRVCFKDFEPRHPQDGARGRKDRQAVANARPESPDTFLEPNAVTADSL